MAEITAQMVKELRERTGQAMMDCKKALAETECDMEKAIDLLRKKGMAVMEKRSERETKEGRIAGKISDDGKVAAMAMMCSETDFTAKNDEFLTVVDAMVNALLNASGDVADEAALSALPAKDGQTVGDMVNDLISKTGEKMTIGQFARYELNSPGLIFCYVHFNNKIGTMLQIESDKDIAGNAEVQQLAADLAMHVTALDPQGLSRDDVDPAAVERERDVAAEQVKGKPAEIMDKIIQGKLDKWFGSIVLLEQPFVKDDSKIVGDLVEEVGKNVGAKLTLKRFARLQIG